MKKNIIKEQAARIESGISKVAGEALDGVQYVVDKTEKGIEKNVAPIRDNVLKRFPIVFMLAVTFGFTATVTGMEQLLIKYDLLSSNPMIILILGVSTMILTGTLYKKLG